MKFIIAVSLLASAAAFVAVGEQKTRIGTTSSLNLWGEPSGKDGESKTMSDALPFVPRPKLLDGSLAGDRGFDPFGFAGEDKASLYYMREAEIKHSRLAMVSCIRRDLSRVDRLINSYVLTLVLSLPTFSVGSCRMATG
jgi:hypothetical protein